MTKTEYVYCRPAIHWTDPTPYPEPTDNRLIPLVEDHRADLKKALDSCNVDKKQMRLWIQGRDDGKEGCSMPVVDIR